jgi:multiple sugar transport system permease protein
MHAEAIGALPVARAAPRQALSPRQAKRRRERVAAYLLMSPALLLMLGILAYPVLWEAWTSLTDLSPLKDGPAAFVGLRNYVEALSEPRYLWAAAVTIVYAVVTSVCKLALGVAFALLLAKPFRGRALVFFGVFLPWVYPSSVSVIGWFWTLNPPLVVSHAVFLGNVKYVVDGLLGDGAWAFISVTLFNIWRGGSFMGIFLLAGINAVPPELFEYSLLESKPGWRRFWLVTVPLLKPFMALAVFLSLTTAFADLSNVWMLTAGRIIFPVIGTEAYWLAIRAGRIGTGMALSLTLVPLLAAVLFWLFRMFDPPEREATI